ncbi:venom prothrombin activator vestarin-D2 isoform X2 [Pseudomyrmex gracilis]|uniref:venom prothrombin activator vestarin-D2 isoform X2 n=1 Tax=Pseudomyrmex gracilis TaxID=219809 RepID=UPI0009956A4D|nr:venom prothrombin activator vestarin-D2 isoform X2 [Pseudomyrmex gracilis]
MRSRREYHRPVCPTTNASPSNCLRWLSRWLRSADLLPGMIAGDTAATILRVLVVLLVLGQTVVVDSLTENRTFGSQVKDDIGYLHSNHQRSAVEHLPKNRATIVLSHFTGWSEWSVCNRHCKQNRVRRCRSRKVCGNTILREERGCKHKREFRQRRCKQRESRGSQRKKDKFHVVQMPKVAEPRYGKRKNKDTKEHYKGQYGKWSKWSHCSKRCTTQRRRTCRKPGTCEQDVIREIALCYVENSFCQTLIHRKIYYEEDDMVLDEFELNPNTVDTFAAEKNSNSWKCGVTNAHKDSRLSYFMRIIGGRPTTPGKWPWQVAVLNRYHEAFCGGTLVSPKWVLTAAHCIRKRLFVRIGEYDLTVNEGTEIELRVESVFIHPDYDVDTVDNDVALLRLPVNLTPSSSRGIACMPAPKQSLPTKQYCTIIGWGKSSVTSGFGTDQLHEVEVRDIKLITKYERTKFVHFVPIVSAGHCKQVYQEYKITNNMFCAGYHQGRKDSCAGDSGGPLLCKDPEKPDRPWTIFGITSFGEGCGKRGKFGIYVKIPNYVRWITRVIKQNTIKKIVLR